MKDLKVLVFAVLFLLLTSLAIFYVPDDSSAGFNDAEIASGNTFTASTNTTDYVDPFGGETP